MQVHTGPLTVLVSMAESSKTFDFYLDPEKNLHKD